MTPGEIVLTFFVAFSSAGLATLVWRQNSQLRAELKGEISALRVELKEEIRDIRVELAIIRSDLTQVALAIGVRRASEA